MHRASAEPTRIILDANILVSAVIASDRASSSELGPNIDQALGGDVMVIVCPRFLARVAWVPGADVGPSLTASTSGRRHTPQTPSVPAGRALGGDEHVDSVSVYAGGCRRTAAPH